MTQPGNDLQAMCPAAKNERPREHKVNLLRMLTRYLISNCLLGASLLVLLGCGKSVLTGGPVDGVVLDATNQQPIANALVVVKWHGVLPTIHSNSVPCYHVEVATTDAAGRYHVNRWRFETKGHAEWISQVNETGPILPVAYKPGYVMPLRRQDDPVRVFMEPFRGTTRERLIYLTDRFDREIMCEADDKSLISLYRSAYEEGKTIARSSGDAEFVDILLISLESAQYGNEDALRRQGVRESEREKSGKQ